MQSREPAVPYVSKAGRERRAARARLARRVRQVGVPYLFLAPFLLLFILFFVLPLGYAFGLSLFVDRLIGGTVFVGAQNYLQVLQDGNFWDGVQRMVLFGLILIPVSLGLALALALVLDSGIVPLASLFRLSFFLPYAIPGVVAALLWGYLYGPTIGPFAQVAAAIHLPSPPFLTDAGMLPSIGNINIWLYTGSNVIIFYAALQAIPGEWRILWSVAMRILMPGFVTILLLSFVGTWNNYFLPLLVLSKQSLYPLTVGLALWNVNATEASTGGNVVYSLVITGALVSIAPLIMAFLFLQRYWQSGLTFGSVRG